MTRAGRVNVAGQRGGGVVKLLSRERNQAPRGNGQETEDKPAVSAVCGCIWRMSLARSRETRDEPTRVAGP